MFYRKPGFSGSILPGLLLTWIIGLLIACPTTLAKGSLWKLQFQNQRPVDCKLIFTRVGRDDKGREVLEADSRGDGTAWHSCVSPTDVKLRKGQDYCVSIDYEIVDGQSADCYFYVFARSSELGQGADKWKRWTGKAGEKGHVKLLFCPTADDYGLTIGIHNKGAITYSGIDVVAGNGLERLTPGQSLGSAPLPNPPGGAKPFTVEAPNNNFGPVINLADFGAVADGSEPPSSARDKNLAAFKAALNKCRERKASKLIVPKGVYRISSGGPVDFENLNDFTFDGQGSTFLFHLIKGGAGFKIQDCKRTALKNFNIDWDWNVEPLASVGRVSDVASDGSNFTMRFEKAAPLDPKRWLTINPLDEKLRVPGVGREYSGLNPNRVESLDGQTVRVWPAYNFHPVVGQLYLLRHFDYNKHCLIMQSNVHLSLQNVTIFSFPGLGFVVGGDQHHYEFLHCRITHPENDRRPITTTADGLHVGQSQGFLKMEDCDFGYMGDDCVNIHDNTWAGVRKIDDHTLVAEGLASWKCPFQVGDPVELRNSDFSPTGFTSNLTSVTPNYKPTEVNLVFEKSLPANLDPNTILFNHRYGSHNFIIRNCYFHENRARGVLCNTADGLLEGNRFFHNQHSALLLLDVIDKSWCEGFGARNIIIRNNKFECNNVADACQGATVFMEATVFGLPAKYPILDNIVFDSNFFIETTGPAIGAKCFKNLVITNNTIENKERPIVDLHMRGSLFAEQGRSLWVTGNSWSQDNNMGDSSFYFDKDSVQEVNFSGNR